jgi:hypothetical protein
MTMLTALIAPAIYLRAGYTSDMGILYDTATFNRLFQYCFYIAIIGIVLSIIPYFFYDLTAKKHKQGVDEIKERVKKADIEEIERYREEGRIGEISPEMLKKYGYGEDGTPPAPEIEPEPVADVGLTAAYAAAGADDSCAAGDVSGQAVAADAEEGENND